MTSKLARHVSRHTTPQSESAREDQVKDNAGGYVFHKWPALRRFLILGTEGGTYYCSEKEHTVQATAGLDACLAEDHKRAVDEIVKVSHEGLAPKNDYAVFALARAVSVDNPAERAYAAAQLAKVCRIGTHLFQFRDALAEFRGWSGGLRRAVGRWYTGQTPDHLAREVTKYAQREGVSHRDMLRLSHVKALTPEQDAIFRWVWNQDGLGERTVKEWPAEKARDHGLRPERHYGPVQKNEYLEAFEALKKAKTTFTIVGMIRNYGFTHEMLPTEAKNHAKVWEALLEKMPMTAMIRNLGKMTEVGLLKPFSDAADTVVERLGDMDALRKARVHPLALLTALKIYAQGEGMRGSLKWSPNPKIIDALDAAFYASFGLVTPTGKRRLVALDVSGSMGMGEIAGSPLNPREASAALAMLTVKTEPRTYVVGFTSSGHSSRAFGGKWGGDGLALTTIDLSKAVRLDDAVKKVSNLPFGGTDCALPMVWATENKIEVDAFEVYTDNETWAGTIHPFQALKQYRQKMGIDACLVVNGMTATEFTIADPRDPRMLDVVGFDLSAPQVMAAFIKGAF